MDVYLKAGIDGADRRAGHGLSSSFLRFVVQYLDEQHSQMIHVAGASLRASDALTLAAVTHPHLALIGMSGPICTTLSVITDLQRMLPSLTIVAMSQLGAAGYVQAARAAGAAGFVDKERLSLELAPALLQAARNRV